MLYFNNHMIDSDTDVRCYKRTNIKPVSDNDYLYFQAAENGCWVELAAPTDFGIELEYSTDGNTWQTWNKTESDSYDYFNRINLPISGDYVFIRAVSSNTFQADIDMYMQFILSQHRTSCGGNIMSLIDSDCSSTTLTTPYCFLNLFRNCASLISPPSLPATILTDSCYMSMFYGCSSLEYVPELPATDLPKLAYCQMFANCSSLVSGADITHVESIGLMSIGMMYRNCTILSSAYAPNIQTWNTTNAHHWLMSVNPTGIVYKQQNLEIETDSVNGIPYGWTSKPASLTITMSASGASDLPFSYTIDGVTKNVQAGDDIVETVVVPTTITFNNGSSGNFVAAGNTFIGIGPTLTVDNVEIIGNNRVHCMWSGEFNQLALTANTANSTISLHHNGNNTTSKKPLLYISTDNRQSWSLFDDTVVTLQNAGDCAYVIGPNKNGVSSGITSYTRFVMTGSISASGNAMSLIDPLCIRTSMPSYGLSRIFYNCSSLTSPPILPATSLNEDCYSYMFYNCSSLTSTPVLPAKTMKSECYSNMFKGCTSLVTPPSLPATTLAYDCYGYMFSGCTSLTSTPTLGVKALKNACYRGMFQNCTSLVTPPSLPATTLADSCYTSMFSGCTSLTSTPVLNATVLGEYSYSYMFSGCTSLTTPPTLPATTMKYLCYSNMFANCTSLTSAPALQSTTLAQGCYNGMFAGCTSLTTPPTLPATTLASSCYSNMFSGCSSLTSAPALQAQTMTLYCYSGMFNGCTSLTAPPTLPSTSLANYCYRDMFNGCTSLTSAPVLPATTLMINCYQNMFNGCSNINEIRTYMTANVVTNLDSWLYGVSPTGDLYCPQNISLTVGESGIPSGWTRHDIA